MMRTLRSFVFAVLTLAGCEIVARFVVGVSFEPFDARWWCIYLTGLAVGIVIRDTAIRRSD